MKVHTTRHFELDELQGIALRDIESRAIALEGRIRVMRDASLEVQDEWSAVALDALASHLRAALPPELLELVEARSGMGWDVYVGHCVHWWGVNRLKKRELNQAIDQSKHTLLLTIAERLASLDLFIEGLKWNEARRVGVSYSDPPWWPVVLGLLIGIAVSRGSWWAPWPLMAIFGAGFGWVARGVLSRQRFCDGPQCGSLLTATASQCERCGGTISL